MVMVDELGAGFANKVLSAQSTFRTVMDAMARPGTVQQLAPKLDAPAPMMPGVAAIALTLFDHDTTLWLDAPFSDAAAVERWLKFHTGAPIVRESAYCNFAIIAEPRALPAFDRFALGSGDYPDRSTTIIVQMNSLSEGASFELTGPGIATTEILRADPLPADFIERCDANRDLFPRGIDLILVADDRLVALPRTTRIRFRKD